MIRKFTHTFVPFFSDDPSSSPPFSSPPPGVLSLFFSYFPLPFSLPFSLSYSPPPFSIGSPSRSLFQEASSFSSTKKFLFGLFIVVIISVSWVISTQTAQSTYNGKFQSPFFLVWIGTSCMVFVFPITAPFYFLFQRSCLNWKNVKKLWR